MQHRQRPVAWPLALSLAAHAVLVLLWWRQAPAPAAPTATAQRAPMVWLRLAPAPVAQPAPVAGAAVAAAPARSRQPPRTAAKPLPAAAPIAEAAPTAAAEPTPPAAARAVAGVAFGSPRWSLPFAGASAGTVFGTRKQPATVPTSAPSITAAAVSPEPSRPPRDQLLQTLEAQVAGWSAPADAQPAQCRLAAESAGHGNTEPECDSLALAQALAERLPTLRDALAALRRLGPDATRSRTNAGDSAALVIAFADGRYRLQLSAH